MLALADWCDKETYRLYTMWPWCDVLARWVNLHLLSAINGYLYGNLPGLTMCAEDRVKWHLISMGSLLDIHPIYFHGQTLISQNHRRDTITVFPASMRDALMVAKSAGEWLLDCRIHGRGLFLLHNTGSGDFQRYDPWQTPPLQMGKDVTNRQVTGLPFGKSVTQSEPELRSLTLSTLW